MRFKQIIKETADQKELLEKYFIVNGRVEFTPEGINVGGGVYLDREIGTPLLELPVKFNKVEGDFHISGIDSQTLRNFNNFPNSVEHLAISEAYSLESTASTTGDIYCINECSIWGARNLRDFTNSSLTVSNLILGNCPNITSLSGLDLNKLVYVYLKSCIRFQDDLGKLPNIVEVVIESQVSDKMPLMRLIVSEKLRYESEYEDPKKGSVAEILKKYDDDGKLNKNYVMQLMRELKANGFHDSARM